MFPLFANHIFDQAMSDSEWFYRLNKKCLKASFQIHFRFGFLQIFQKTSFKFISFSLGWRKKNCSETFFSNSLNSFQGLGWRKKLFWKPFSNSFNSSLVGEKKIFLKTSFLIHIIHFRVLVGEKKNCWENLYRAPNIDT